MFNLAISSTSRTLSTAGKMRVSAAPISVGQLLGALFLLLAANNAMAATTCHTATETGSGYEFSPAFGSLNFPRDRATGSGATLLPSVGFPGAVPYQIACTNTSATDSTVNIHFQAQVAPVSGFTDVYASNLKGLGVRYNFGGSCNVGTSLKNQQVNAACTVRANSTLRLEWGTSVDFVQTESSLSSGALTSITKVKMFYSVDFETGAIPVKDMYIGTATGTVATVACQTPDVAVSMGEHAISEFPAIGSTSNVVKFKLGISSCPSGILSVKYKFDNSSQGTVGSEGLVALTPASTAQGIKLLLMSNDGKPAKLDTWNSLLGYNSSLGGNYVVDLQAAYKRTGDISGGNADAEVLFTMKYE